MVAEAPETSMHFGRFRVTKIALNELASAQFDDGPRLEAAGLLADARVKAICWNGASAGWLGFDTDRALCAGIERRTGVAASSSVSSLADTFRRTGVERYGLATHTAMTFRRRFSPPSARRDSIAWLSATLGSRTIIPSPRSRPTD
jgi:maleate isomerase